MAEDFAYFAFKTRAARAFKRLQQLGLFVQRAGQPRLVAVDRRIGQRGFHLFQRRIQARDLRRLDHGLLNERAPRRQLDILWQVANAHAALHGDRAHVRRHRPGDHLQQGRFAHPAGPHQPRFRPVIDRPA